MTKSRIGLVGLGYWGKNILRNLYELGGIHTACESNLDTLVERKKQFPDINYTSNFEELLNNSEIQAIVIATPAVTHYDLVKESLNAGKDVFVEKPLALTAPEGEELVKLAKEKKRILMVGHILQYHPAIIKLKELIKKGELGKIQYIYSNRLNFGKIRTEENILWSFAPHDISVILMLAEEEPIRVEAFGKDILSQGTYDISFTNLGFKSGLKSHIFVSWLHPTKEQKLVVVGSKAMAVFDDTIEEKLLIYPHKVEWVEGKIPIAKKADHYSVQLEKNEPLKDELKHFIDCVEKRKTPKTDGEEGLRVLKVLEKADQSIKNLEIGVTEKEKPYFVHPTSVVDDNTKIGKDTKIWHFSHILKNTRIGENCVLGQNVVAGPDVEIGDSCKIQNNVSLYKGVTLEEGVFCGPSCVFTNVYNPRAFIERKNEFLPTLVKKGATIGANATIVCGTTIGRYALVGAGAVIKKDVPDYAIVAGVPAKVIGWACKCGTPLKGIKKQEKCEYCGNKYSLDKDKLTIIKE